METTQTLQIKKYLDLLVRKKTLILSCILIGAAAGLAFYLNSPKVYQSEVLLSYQQQAINPARMSPDEGARIRTVVSTLSQIVLSRSSLEKVITSVGLYSDQQQALPMAGITEMMRQKITITPSRQGDTFTITYIGGDPELVARVSNALAARFIEENLKYREEKASDTSAYTEDELEMAKEIMDEKDTIMRDYKLQNYNMMPDQQASNIQRLIALQTQYQSRQESIQDLERTRVLVQDQIASRRLLLQEAQRLRVSSLQTSNVEQVATNDENELMRLTSLLKSYQDRYTEKHPEIRRLKKAIARLEASGAANSDDAGSSSEGGASTVGRHDEVIADLQIQLTDIKLSINNLNKEKEQLIKLINQYEKWVEAAPVKEAEWVALTREHGELRRHYDFLVAQNLQARSVLNLERKQKGSQFKIEDSATVPQRPIKPVFIQVIAIAILLGTGVGGGLAFGLSLLDTSFRSPEELKSAFDIDMICSIPYVPLKRELRKERVLSVLASFVLLVCVSGIGYAFLYFWKQGQIIL